MLYEFDSETITTNSDLANMVLFIHTEFEKYSQDKSFRNRLVEICETNSLIKTGYKKWLLIQHFGYSYKVDGLPESTSYVKNIPLTVDEDKISIVYDICVKVYGSLVVPIVQFSIPAQRSKLTKASR
jgi:hypothetical protein